jgi:hypothetical protein
MTSYVTAGRACLANVSGIVLACIIATFIFSVPPKSSVHHVLESMDSLGRSASANGFLSSIQKYHIAQSAMSVKEVQLNMQQQLFSMEQRLESKPMLNPA